ncbi:macro domain-containing protein [Phytohabitans sp. LJ34]|uniref:macro domain-containing protein n=1 Tax=Phytohabitans sp. LJ34 TaxID=3452217 RepID=UPI003F889AE2
MRPARPPVDPAEALAEFCAALQRLHKEAGGPTVDVLHWDQDVPLRRTQIYATLAGEINAPPTFDFVQAFVQRCKAFAAQQKRALSPVTSGWDWAGDHHFLAELWRRSERATPPPEPEPPVTARPLTVQEISLYPVPGAGPPRAIGVITGSLRQIRSANVWVNSENTEMRMARFEEFSISAVIRYEGARHDSGARVVDDIIADELEAKVAGRRPVAPGTAIVTGAGELFGRNGVRHIVHVATVQGEPGRGYRPARDLARCVDNALLAAETLEMPDGERVTILIPLLGTGNGGADVVATADTLIHTAANYLRTTAATRIETVLFQAYTDVDRRACHRALRSAGLSPAG